MMSDIVLYTAETCPGRPCSEDCDHVESLPPKQDRLRHFAREVAHCLPACIIVHLFMEVLL